MKRTAWLAMVLPVGVGVLCIARYEGTPVDEETVVARGPRHVGARIVSSAEKTLSAPRQGSARYRIHGRAITCPPCEAPKAAEHRRPRAERERSNGAERQELARMLTTRFGVVGDWMTTGSMEPTGNVTLHPGDDIEFKLQVKNLGAKPVSGLRVIIEPIRLLTIREAKSHYAAGMPFLQSEVRALNSTNRRKLDQLGSSGLPVAGSDGTAVRPYDDPCYQSETAEWDSWDKAGFSAKNGLATYDGFGSALTLRKDLWPNKHIEFRGYLVAKGHKILVGVATVHLLDPK